MDGYHQPKKFANFSFTKATLIRYRQRNLTITKQERPRLIHQHVFKSPVATKYCQTNQFYFRTMNDTSSAKAESNISCNLEMKRTALPRKKGCWVCDTHNCRKERKLFMTVGSLWGFPPTILPIYKRYAEYNFEYEIHALFYSPWLLTYYIWNPLLAHKPLMC
jgi:hypothetical protein